MAKEPRFPGITWYCDKCNACLSSQKGFDDHKYTWKCRECGFKNSISWDNVNSGDSVATKMLLYFLGFLSFTGFWTSVMLAISIFALHADRQTYMIPFLIFLGLYLVAFIFTIVLQFTLRRKRKTAKNIIFEILYDFTEDLRMPFTAIKEIISNILSFITHHLPIKRKYIWHSNWGIIIFAIIYIALFAVEIIAFNHINHFTLADWWNWIQSGFKTIVDFITGLLK